jgi:biotin carboxyl carrier protein
MMAKYQIAIGENNYTIEITEESVRINGEVVDVDLQQLNDAGLFLLNHGDEKLELHLASEGANTYIVTTDGQQIEALVETEGQKQRRSKSITDSKELYAPIPGVVLDIKVAVRDEVKEGQVACILESMKMQMIINFPSGGIVSEIYVTPNQNVAKGDVIIRLE